MTGSISSELVKYAVDWAKASSVQKVDFTVGVLYGTQKKSNKKDWHILRRACLEVDALGSRAKVIEYPNDKWQCHFRIGKVHVTARVCIGKSLWDLIGGRFDAYTELLCAAIRASIVVTNNEPQPVGFEIPDLPQIISMTSTQRKLNFTLLQKSQIEWFLLMSAHFSECLVD